MAGELFAYAVIGVFAGLVLLVLGLLWFRQKQLIENTPTSKVRSLAMGLVEIFGEVIPAEKRMLKSPFSGEDCIYYNYSVQELRQQGKTSTWVTVRSGEDRTKFYLRDDTGQVLVDPAGASIELSPDYEYGSGWGRDPPPNVIAFLDSQGIGHASFLGINKQMRFVEYDIMSGDKLYIMGTAGDNPYVEEGTAKQSYEDIMIHKGNNEKFYMISDKPEKDLLSTFRIKVAVGIVGGIALVAGCLAIIFINP